MSKRQQIVDAIIARLKTITIANGYSFNLGDNIFEWRVKPLETLKLPAMVIRDVANNRVDGAIGSFTWNLNVELQLIAEGETTAQDMRKMIADVYRAIGMDETWEGLAVTTEQPGDEMDMEHQEKKIMGTIIRLSVIYVSDRWKM